MLCFVFCILYFVKLQTCYPSQEATADENQAAQPEIRNFENRLNRYISTRSRCVSPSAPYPDLKQVHWALSYGNFIAEK